jgi:hypothetical protein
VATVSSPTPASTLLEDISALLVLDGLHQLEDSAPQDIKAVEAAEDLAVDTAAVEAMVATKAMTADVMEEDFLQLITEAKADEGTAVTEGMVSTVAATADMAATAIPAAAETVTPAAAETVTPAAAAVAIRTVVVEMDTPTEDLHVAAE